MLKLILLLLVTVLITACSSGGRSDRLELTNYYKLKTYDLGLKFIDESKYFKEKNERLLFLIEKAKFLHAKEEYLASNLLLEEAKKLISELFTIRVSKKAEKAILNDTYDVFYGEEYERSMVFFYSSLNSILQYQKDGNRENLFKARADVLGWDSYLNSIKEDRLGKSVYKNDLMLKIYGAKIHEVISSREDDQIALQLYKDALNVLYRNYNSYKSFNQLSREFKNDFEKLSTMKDSEIAKKYINETSFQKSLKIYINDNIERLTKKKNAHEASEKVTILLENGLIASKYADKTRFGLEGLSNEPFFNLFVADVLGLTPGPNTYDPGAVYAGAATANVAMKLFSFSFEIPKVNNDQVLKTINLNVKNISDEIILKKELNLINPMGDIAEEAINESSSAVYARVGARLTGKHVAAILASFATYRGLGGGQKDNYMAKNIAVLQYAAATRLIEESEKADTRNWSTLPNEFRIVDLELKPGTYKLDLDFGNNEIKFLGNIVIGNDGREKLIKFSSF